MTWGSQAERETKQRLTMALAAYAYEFLGISLMSDADFDAECLAIDLDVDTGYPEWDAWWRQHFEPSTGMWIRDHPDLDGLARRVQWLLEIL